MTHTYVELIVSKGVYNEIKKKLRDAKYDHAFIQNGLIELIDMHGIALKEEQKENK